MLVLLVRHKYCNTVATVHRCRYAFRYDARVLGSAPRRSITLGLRFRLRSDPVRPYLPDRVRATRKPREMLRYSGEFPRRNADRQYSAQQFQLRPGTPGTSQSEDLLDPH